MAQKKVQKEKYIHPPKWSLLVQSPQTATKSQSRFGYQEARAETSFFFAVFVLFFAKQTVEASESPRKLATC